MTDFVMLWCMADVFLGTYGCACTGYECWPCTAGSTYPAELMVKPGASQTSLVAEAPAETAAGAGVHATRRRKERQLAGASDAEMDAASDAGNLVLSAGSMGMAPTNWHTQRKQS